MKAIRQATVSCPKCGHHFVVRDNGGIPKERADRIFKASDEAFAAIDRLLKQLFHPSLWK